MRILIAVHGFPPTHAAGAELRAERMARWMTNHGHEVEVFTIERLDSPGFQQETSVQDGIPVHRLFYDVNEGDDTFRKLYDYPLISQAFRAVVSDRPFDLVHIVSGYLLAKPVVEVAKELSLPVVLTLTEYWFMCARLNLIRPSNELCSGPERAEKCARCLMESKRRYRLPSQAAPKLLDMFWSVFEQTSVPSTVISAVAERQTALRNILDSVDIVICPSQTLIQKFAEFGFDTERYLYIRQGLAAPAALPAARPEQDSPVLRLGYTGQIKPHKGVDLLIDAAVDLLNANEPITLDIWGAENEAPDYVANLKKRTSAYPAIRWNGRYKGGKVWTVLADMDVLVMPSRWYENSPNSILEAQTMRLPIIATNLGGMAELVHHEKNGLLFELDDAQDLQHQIKRLIDDRHLLGKLRAGIPAVKTIDEEMYEILSHYRRCLHQVP
jgi:glycosyltransferase involved in cell wall biosynthesis